MNERRPRVRPWSSSWLIGLVVAALAAPSGHAVPTPRGVEGVGLRVPDEAAVPPGVQLKAPAGRAVSAGELLDDERPTVWVLAYSDCPMLCSLVLRGLAEAVGDAEARPGDDYALVTVSIDPDERPDIARRTLTRLKSVGGLDDESDAWRYFLAEEAEVRRLAAALGFSYRYDEEQDQYAHPAAVFVLTPGGEVSAVLQDLKHAPGALDEALAGAARGEQAGSLASRALDTVLQCFRFEPADRKYGELITLGLRGLAGTVMLGLVVSVGWLSRRRRRR